MKNNKKSVSPSSLYPIVTIESIDPEILKKVIGSMEMGIESAPVKVMDYEGYYFILDGEYEMLAANIVHKKTIDIEIVNRFELKFWSKEENIKEQLKTVGMNALYDFEGIGDFKYMKYPIFYKGGK